MTKRDEIIHIFPDSMKNRWEHALCRIDKLQEIRLGVGQPVRLKFAGEEKFLSSRGIVNVPSQDLWYITEWEMDEIIKNICRYLKIVVLYSKLRRGLRLKWLLTDWQ